MTTVFMKAVHPDVKTPLYATEGAAGFDMYCNEDIELFPNQRMLVKLGFCCEVPHGHALLVAARSGLSLRYGLEVVNGIGIVDSDYRGEVGVILKNGGDGMFRAAKGDRICQGMVIQPVQVFFKWTETLTETDRGQGGFGSTGGRAAGV